MSTELQFNTKIGMKGLVRLEVGKESTGRIMHDTGWFPNLILNEGMNAPATHNGFVNWFHVGTDSTPPVVTDTWLGGLVASLNTIQASTAACNGSPPYYGYKRITRRYPAGTATGNLSEIGVGWSSTPGTLFSRAQIKDSGGSPTTITVLADEYLDFTYELRYYPPVNDVTGTVSLDGESYNYTVRALAVTDPFWWATYIGNTITPQIGFTSYHEAYTGGSNAVTASTPLGTNSTGITNVTAAAYSADTWQRDMTASATTTQWNVAGGEIGSLVLGCYGCRFQAAFSKVSDGSGLPKSSLNSLIAQWRVSWARG